VIVEFLKERLPALLLVGLILWPNLLFVFFPPRNLPAAEKPTKAGLIMTLLEQGGRVGVMALPFFYTWSSIRLTGWLPAVLAGMAICLLLYYLGWVRFFCGGREYSELFSPLPGLSFLPVPMAVFPAAYFLLTAAVFSSWSLAAAAVIFAAGHISTALHDSSAYNRRYN